MSLKSSMRSHNYAHAYTHTYTNAQNNTHTLAETDPTDLAASAATTTTILRAIHSQMFVNTKMDHEVLSTLSEPDLMTRQHLHSVGLESRPLSNTTNHYADHVPYLIAAPGAPSSNGPVTSNHQHHHQHHHPQQQQQQHHIPQHHPHLQLQHHNTDGTNSHPDSDGIDSAGTERARAGLALAMDLLCMPHTEHPALKETQSTPVRPATRSTPVSSPSVASTPSARQSGFNVSPSTLTELDCGGMIRQDSGVDTTMPPRKLCSDDIPVLDSFPGYYGFDLYRPLCGDAYEAAETKPSTSFFYFKDEQGWTNLYSKKTPAWWTLSYWCQRQPPEGSFLRLTPVYGTSDKQQEVIQRCFEDFMAMPTNSLARYSIIVVGNSLADYFYDPNTERLCITLPYERPKEGCEYSQFNGKFMCFNSCLHNGGQGNKKPLFLIVTLERLVSGSEPSKGQCEVLGRQCIKFRSCACPKRDKENSERRTGGESVCGSVHGFGKRKKDMDRNDRQSKKMRTQSQEFSAASAKSSFQLNGRWLSPNHDLYQPETSNPDDDDETDPRHPRLFGDHETGSSVINYNGESYHMLLVPTSLPGGLETMAGVRFGLLRTWLYAQSLIKPSPPNRVTGTSGDLKSECLTEKAMTDGNTNDPSQVYTNPSRSMEADTVLHQLLAIESQLAHIIRERIFPSGSSRGPYHYSGESTDSQPNSNGAVGGLSLGSVDEPGNANTEFPTPGNVGPLSSDSGVSSDPIQHHAPLLMNGSFSAPSIVHRSALYSASIPQSGVYDLDYGNRFQNTQITQLYPQHLINNTQLRNSIGLSYFPEITDTYPMLQPIPQSQSASPTSDHVVATVSGTGGIIDQSDTSKPAVTSSSGGTRAARTDAANLSGSLSSFAPSAFYHPPYFTNRSATNSDHTSTSNATALLDQFPARGHMSTGPTLNGINSSSNGVSTGLCFYPTTVGSATTLSESLLIPEEVISTYLDREKGYDEADGHHHVLLGRNPEVS